MTKRQAPTAAALVYLFADRVVSVNSVPLSASTIVPCTRKRVHTPKLATTLLASALWSLRQQGLIALDLSRTKRFLLNSHGVRVRLLRRVGKAGLEGAILDNLAGHEDNVRDVILRWFGAISLDPCTDVVRCAAEEVSAAGYTSTAAGATVDGTSDAHDLSRDIATEVDCEAVEKLSQTFQGFASSWRSFQEDERPLYQELVRQCSIAMKACTQPTCD